MSERHPTDAELRQPGAARLAVLGSPISHSKSPAIHSAAYRELGLPWEYQSFELQPEDLAAFLDAREADWRGFSVTMPLKEEAARLATVTDELVAETGVANTLLRLTDGRGGAQWAGFNTDVWGLARAIARAGADTTATLVIGSGATALSAVHSVRSLGAIRTAVAARRDEAARELAARFDTSVTATRLEDAVDFEPTLVVSTIPGPAGAQLAVPTELTRVPLFDVAYDPWPSPLAARWREHRGEAFMGLDMLVEQALAQVRIFMNGDPGLPLDDEESVLATMRAASVER